MTKYNRMRVRLDPNDHGYGSGPAPDEPGEIVLERDPDATLAPDDMDQRPARRARVRP